MADGPEATNRQGFLAELKRRRVIRVLVPSPPDAIAGVPQPGAAPA